MFIEKSKIQKNSPMKRKFYNSNIDILFNERGYKFDSKDMREKIFREMILDSIMLLDDNHVDCRSVPDWFDNMKDNLIDKYYGFISYVDNYLSDKKFDYYCADSYEKAIDCSIEIYEKLNLNKTSGVSRARKFKTSF